MINKFDELQVFTGERESILFTITRYLRQDGSEERKTLMDKLISTKDVASALTSCNSKIVEIKEKMNTQRSAQNTLHHY